MILTFNLKKKNLYFNSLLYRLEHIQPNKFNYENDYNIICNVCIKNNFDIKIIKNSYKHYIILIKKAIDNCSIKHQNFLSGKLVIF